MKIIFLCFLYAVSPFLLADLSEKRGFIVFNSEGVPFLSSTPNLKSCCIGLKGETIRLQGLPRTPAPYQAVTLLGTLVEGPLFIVEKEL